MLRSAHVCCTYATILRTCRVCVCLYMCNTTQSPCMEYLYIDIDTDWVFGV